MIRLNQEQVNQKINFINQYLYATNAADGSKLDANANVSIKNIATLEAEINKDINIQINRQMVYNQIKDLFSEDLAREYIRQIEKHEIYVHDETSLKPYCVSVNMYPLLLNGLTKMGGESKAPKNLGSFCGTFINFVFAVSSQFAGAVATVEFLMYFDHFARLTYGNDYYLKNKNEIESYFQQVVYSINQPAAARGYQSVFWNISIYDQYYFNSLFENFIFPNGDVPNWQSVSLLQKLFITWFSKEREKALLTFPVVTVAMLTANGSPKDTEYHQFYANELARGNSFFMYLSPTADSLASCCRLRNEVSSNEFSYTLGAGGIATGSINVITINFNRLIQDQRSLADEITKIQKYQIAYRKLIENFKDHGMLTAYDAGFISLDKQYLTIGINGLVEAAEYLGLDISDNNAYKEFVSANLKIIYDLNREMSKKTGYRFNTEFVPAENLGIKNAQWDRKDGYQVNRDCYNSYFYKVEDDEINPLEKFILHGDEIIQFLDGGSALHLNLNESLTAEQYKKIITLAGSSGCNYFCINVKNTVCNDCGYINKKTTKTCTACGSDNIDYATRVIGYLKKLASFSSGRKQEHNLRSYHQFKNKRKDDLKSLNAERQC